MRRVEQFGPSRELVETRSTLSLVRCEAFLGELNANDYLS